MRRLLPLLLVLAVVAALLVHGPIAQLAHYHQFADQRPLLGVAAGANVFSNFGFAVIGIWGLILLKGAPQADALAFGCNGYTLFHIALVLTALGSSFYHLAPDDGRLIFDRLPIALACAGLLAAVPADLRGRTDSHRSTLWLAAAAMASVAWWRFTAARGVGDLRPYLLLQGLPLVLIPLWQWLDHAPRADRRAFLIAILFYVLAKLCELQDASIFAATGISGHTLKHLLASGGAAAITWRLQVRIRERADARAAAGVSAPSVAHLSASLNQQRP